MSSTQQLLSKLYGWVLFAPALLPLIYLEGMMYPMMAPKTFLLRGLALIALALFAYLALSGRAFYWSRLRAWQSWLPAGLLAAAYLSSVLGMDFYHSFWSTLERGDGLLTLTAVIAYFYLIVLSADRDWLMRLLRLAGWVGSIAGLYLVLQWLFSLIGVEPFFIAPHSGRFGGTLGNAAFFAAYAGMALFATVYAASTYTGVKRRLLMAGAALELLAILLAATRGTILALLATGLIALFYLAYQAGPWRGRARIGLGVVLIVIGVFALFREPLSRLPIEPVARLASISTGDRTVSSRLFVWENMAREALKNPVLGVGAEHIDTYFDRFYDPVLISEEWFDRSHNVYLDYLAQYGILGLAFYLAILILLFFLGWRLWKPGFHSSSGSQVSPGPFLLGIAAVYALQNLFVFDTAVTLWLLFAVLAAALASTQPDEAHCISPRPLVGAVVGVLLLLLVVPVSITPWRANLLAFEAYLYQVSDVPRARAATEKGLSLETYADLEFGYNAYFMYTENQLAHLKGEELATGYRLAAEVLERAFRRYPYDARTALYLTQVLAGAPEGEAADQELIAAALNQALALSPKRSQAWYVLANLSIAKANTYPSNSPERQAGYAAAIDILESYTTQVPGLAQPYFVIAQLEYARGNQGAANEAAEKGRELYSGGLSTARRAAVYYLTVYDLQNAAFFLREVVRMDPADKDARADLEQIEAYERAET